MSTQLEMGQKKKGPDHGATWTSTEMGVSLVQGLIHKATLLGMD